MKQVLDGAALEDVWGPSGARLAPEDVDDDAEGVVQKHTKPAKRASAVYGEASLGLP